MIERLPGRDAGGKVVGWDRASDAPVSYRRIRRRCAQTKWIGLVMTPRLLNPLVAGALVAAMAACGGCALLAADVVPSVLGASPVVVENLGSGQGNSYWAARFDDVVQATLRAGEKLSLELKEQEIEENRARLQYVGGREMEINLRIEFWTETVTRVRLNIGSRRSSGFGRLLGQQIVEELNDADAFVVDWSAKKGTDPE